jgi:restriction system protein
MQRTHATQVHAQQRAQAAAVRQQQQIRRNADLAVAAAQQAEAAADQREKRRLYAEARAAAVAAANADLDTRIERLETLLLSTLAVDDHIDLNRFKKRVAHPPFNAGPLGQALPEPAWQSFDPPVPTGLTRVFGGEARHQQQVATAREAFEQARARHVAAEADRQRQLTARRAAYQEHCRAVEAKIAAHNAQIDRFAASVAAGEPAAVVEYFGMVLGNSVYPDDFPQHYRLAYLPGSRQLVVEYHLPPVEVIPTVRQHRYLRDRDEVATIARAAQEIRQRYAHAIAQVSLRTVHELFEADRSRLVETVTFNGIVDTVDRRTGQSVRPCLVSLRTTRDRFAALNLGRVDPAACLRHLDAAVSAHPDELEPVRPVVEFDRVDTRFSDDVDVLADLDHRPNLQELSMGEFAALVEDLFTAMGLRLGKAEVSPSLVEWPAVDPRPIFGGAVVIRATRHRELLDEPAARGLVEAMLRTGAAKGILVTTSGYAVAAHEFASGRPLELIDGSTLLHLLAEYTSTKARIDTRQPA